MGNYFLTRKAVEDITKIYEYMYNKHIIFYRILNATEIEIERILGADMDLKKRMKE